MAHGPCIGHLKTAVVAAAAVVCAAIAAIAITVRDKHFLVSEETFMTMPFLVENNRPRGPKYPPKRYQGTNDQAGCAVSITSRP